MTTHRPYEILWQQMDWHDCQLAWQNGLLSFSDANILSIQNDFVRVGQESITSFIGLDGGIYPILMTVGDLQKGSKQFANDF